MLRWHNGDVLPGRLLASESGQIRWSSPVFADDLAVDINAVDAIQFPTETGQTSEAFRIGTVTGDVFTADLIGSSDNDFLFASQRLGQVRVNRDAVYSMNRRVHPNLVFDGSQFGQWQLLMDGPIRNLGIKVYKGNWTWGDDFPDLAELTPVDEARFVAGYLDLGLSRFEGRFAMSFEGDIAVPSTGQYQFEGSVDDAAHLWIDGKKIRNDADIANRYRSVVTLAQGSHSLKLEYIDLGGEARLSLWMINARDEYTSLAESSQTSGWQQGLGGHPQTSRKHARLSRALELPDQFEIDLELTSSSTLQFVLAIGRETDSDETNQSPRLETWGDELVVVQDQIFEPVMTLGKHMRDVRLRLVFDSDNPSLQVFDASGGLLVEVKGVQTQAGESGIVIRNRGEDLTVRRLGVYHRLNTGARQVFDAARTRVHLVNGEVVYGHLHVTDGAAFVVDQAGIRHRIDLDQVDRMARPGAALAVTANMSELIYADGAIVRGRVVRMASGQVILQTGFSDEPVTCGLGRAALLRFDARDIQASTSSDGMDELFTSAGRLRGRLSFDLAGSPLSWHVPGVAPALRLAGAAVARIQRHRQSLPQGPAMTVDSKRFPWTLHLKNGEVIPCRVLSCDKAVLDFDSPFVLQRACDAQSIKAIEFMPLKRQGTGGTNAWLNRTLRYEQERVLDVDPVKLARALTVPRFNRSTPPTHILMARNGDLKRGTLLGMSTRSVQFESKLRTQTIPVARLARVVDVSRPGQDPNAPARSSTDVTAQVRANLINGSILIFTPVESRGGQLLGRSAIYGDVTIPCDMIEALNLGGFEPELFRSPFDGWGVHPSEEPVF
ncbi:MAG: hypothetical protein K9N55_08900 [Phycisphaerae bacterium]|nr:hypothetical protein [Phycisphaerae bacterium]